MPCTHVHTHRHHSPIVKEGEKWSVTPRCQFQKPTSDFILLGLTVMSDSDNKLSYTSFAFDSYSTEFWEEEGCDLLAMSAMSTEERLKICVSFICRPFYGIFTMIVFPAHGATCVCVNDPASGSRASPLHSMPVCSCLCILALRHNEPNRYKPNVFPSSFRSFCILPWCQNQHAF